MTKAELKKNTNGVILNVLITEKGSRLSLENRYLLEVAPDASKPQIAAMADAHFYIEKHVTGTSTVTQLTLLDEERSVAELGRMLGGVAVTDKVLESAREMKKMAMQAK